MFDNPNTQISSNSIHNKLKQAIQPIQYITNYQKDDENTLSARFRLFQRIPAHCQWYGGRIQRNGLELAHNFNDILQVVSSMGVNMGVHGYQHPNI